MRAAAFPIALSALALTGCSTTPLPEDFSGKNTYEVVQKIRCEARDAVRGKAIALMLAAPQGSKTHAIGVALQNGSRRFDQVSIAEFDKETAGYFMEYANAAIAYDFSFDISEQSKNSATVNFKGPIGLDVFSLGLTSGGDFTRNNTRNFSVSDNFGALATKLEDRYCDGLSSGTNAVYPITGKIGLAERIDTFVDLNQSGGLVPANGSTVKQMADTVRFTTVLSIDASPKLEIKSPGSRLADASFTSQNTRTDQHQVVIGLKMPEVTVVAAPATKGKKPVVVKGTAERTRLEALQVIDQQYNRAGYELLREIRRTLDTK